MQSRLFIALPILLALSGCSEEIQSHDQQTTPDREISASEATDLVGAKSEADAPDTEPRASAGFD